MALTKSHALLAALLTVVAAVGQTPRAAEGLSLSGVGSVIPIVSGVAPCSIGSSINPALVPGFPNATVQLVCGSAVVTTVTASTTGAFIINPINASLGLLVSLLAGQCRVAVATPLVSCNASLAGVSGTLAAPLQLLGPGTGIGGGGIIGTVAGLSFTIVGGLVSFITESFGFA